MINASQNTTPTFKGSVKHLSKFLACLVGTTAMCLTAYTMTVDSLVQDSKVPSTYKWFLLKEVPGPRIIFESGSNSHHAINTDLIGEELGITAINIADNGGYALEDKVTRLETYARPGDVIILPLEWTFYHREKLTDNYVETLFTNNRDYYQSMPPSKRLKRALSLPPEKVIKEVFKKKDRPVLDTESPAKNLFVAMLTQATGHQSRESSIGPGLGVDEQSCDDYILGKAPQRKLLTVGSNLKPALKRLKKLKKQGVDIHFSWPVLVGDGCMSDPAYVKGFRTEIEEAVNDAGFNFLGAPSQSLYGQEYQDDTPYHVISKGTDVHTEKMIAFLKSQGYADKGAPLDIKTFARHRLLELELAQAGKIKQPELPAGQIVKMDNENFRSHVEFTAGWWGFEPYGRWMRDNRAMFRITLSADTPKNSVLELQGSTKSGRPELVNVSVNGQLISTGMFGGSAPLLVPVANLPQREVLSIFLSLPDADVPQSPFDRGENQDARSMTLHLQSLQLTTPRHLEQQPKILTEKVTLVQSIEETFKPQEPVTQVRLASPANTEMYLNNMTPLFASGPPSLVQNCSQVDSAAAKAWQVEFLQGWWPQEAAGRWMNGKQASLKIVLPINQTKNKPGRYILKLNGDFFMGQYHRVSAVIDGEIVGPFNIGADGSLFTRFETDKTDGMVDVTLNLALDKPQSPKELGLSQDDRTLTYFLKSINIAEA